MVRGRGDPEGLKDRGVCVYMAGVTRQRLDWIDVVLYYGIWWRLIRALSEAEVGCTHSLASVSAGSPVTSLYVGIFATN